MTNQTNIRPELAQHTERTIDFETDECFGELPFRARLNTIRGTHVKEFDRFAEDVKKIFGSEAGFRREYPHNATWAEVYWIRDIEYTITVRSNIAPSRLEDYITLRVEAFDTYTGKNVDAGTIDVDGWKEETR